MKLLRISGFFLAASFIVLQGCQDDPNPVGIGLLPIGDLPLIKTDTLYATAHSTSRSVIVTSRADAYVASWIPDRLMLGKNQNYESWAFVKFTVPDTLLGVQITGARIQLRSSYYFGISGAQLSLIAYPALKNWLGDSLTFDSLGTYYNTATPASQIFTATVGDADSIQLPLDTALIRTWFTPNADSLNQGVLLRPMNTSLIKGFASFLSSDVNARPKLIISYLKNGQAGTYTDSIGVSKYVPYISASNLVTNPQMMYVQNGVSYRSFLTFSFDSFPRPSSINRAQLEVSLSDTLFNKYTNNSLYVFFMNNDGSVAFSTYRQSDTVTVNGVKVYRISIAPYVQEWLRTRLPARVALAGFSESNSMDLFILHGFDAPNKAVRPRIVVTYSTTR